MSKDSRTTNLEPDPEDPSVAHPGIAELVLQGATWSRRPNRPSLYPKLGPSFVSVRSSELLDEDRGEG